MSDLSHTSSVHGNLNTQKPIDVYAMLAKNSHAIYELRDKMDKVLQIQERKSHRSKSREGQRYYRNKEYNKQPYSSNKEVFHQHNNMAQYPSSSYPRNDYKKEGYPSKPQSRDRPCRKIYVVDPIVPTLSFPLREEKCQVLHSFKTSNTEYPLSFMIMFKKNKFLEVLSIKSSFPKNHDDKCLVDTSSSSNVKNQKRYEGIY